MPQKKKMRIGVLMVLPPSGAGSSMMGTNIGPYKKKSSTGGRMLAKAIKGAGHTPVMYYSNDCLLYFGNDGTSRIFYKGKEIKGCDILITRVGVSAGLDIELSTVKQFELMGFPVLNKYMPVARAKNKLRSMQILAKAKIPVPSTVVVRHFDYLDQAIKQVGGYPVIVKSVFGSFGKGVAIIESRRSLYSALDVLWRFGETNILLIQEYVMEADNSDFRAFVIGDKVVAAMKRTAKSGDFRSNVHQGGNMESVDLTVEEKKIAIKATKLMGLDYAGVDIMRSSKGPIVIEVNANPGFAGINTVAPVDVPGALVEYAVKQFHKLKK